METPHTSESRPGSGERLYWLRVVFGAPLALFGGVTTLVFLAIVGAYVAGRIGGDRPSPSLVNLFFAWLFFGGAPLSLGVLLLVRAWPPRKRLFGRVFLVVVLLFLAVGTDTQCGPKNWHSLFRREKLLQADAAHLRRTIVTPHLDAEIAKGTNLLWCGTFQLCWNEACSLTGGDLRLLGGTDTATVLQHPMAEALNKHAFTKESIDEGSFVAMAGFVSNNIQNRVASAIKEKFRGAFTPRFLPEKSVTPRPQDFIAYACLYKNLGFPVPFERLEDAFSFGGDRVRAFGIGEEKASHEKMYPQVLIQDYQSQDDFVIELKIKSEGDRLILAKIQPQSNLVETVATVRKRMVRGDGEPALTNDVLIVPRMNFDLTRRYSELEDRWLVPTGGKVAHDLLLLSAVQNTRFELNEKGVELASEAHVAFGCGKEAQPVRQHRMVFDKPFLVLMERSGSKMPYFALWVDNPEVLVPW